MLESFNCVRISSWVVVSWYPKKRKLVGIKNTKYWVFFGLKWKKASGKGVFGLELAGFGIRNPRRIANSN